jgi:hypothetical protein
VTYRDPPEKKIVKHRIVLTRDEVDRIVRAKLANDGKIPAEHAAPELDKGTALRWMAALEPPVAAAPPPVDEKPAPWEHWPGFVIEWSEEIGT